MNIFGGLAISKDNGSSFKRFSEAPIIERNRVNPLINTSPFVISITDNLYYMYYVAGVEWVHKDLPKYNIQLAISKNGIDRTLLADNCTAHIRAMVGNYFDD